MNARAYEQAIEAEVAEWPGAHVSFEMGGKHKRAVLNLRGASRFVTFPASPSDNSRGALNAISNVRRELVELGGQRNERAKSMREPSWRNPGADLRETPGGEIAPVIADPWQPLRDIAQPFTAYSPADKPWITYHADFDQGSEAWLQARCGLLTASEMKLILTPTLKVANNDKTRAHAYEIAAQRITRYVEPHYIGDEMLRGHEDEVRARLAYAEAFGEVRECGFITSDKWGFTIGYSPDALVGNDGLLECKSRRQKFQVQTFVDGTPDEHILQLQTGLLVTEREWIEYVSYSGGMPMAVIREHADKLTQDAIVEAATSFEQRVADIIGEYEHQLTAGRIRWVPTERVVEQEMFLS